MHINFLNSALIVEIINIGRTPCSGQSIINSLNGNAEGRGFLKVNVNFELRHIFLAVWPDVIEDRTLTSSRQELVPCFSQLFMSGAGQILQEYVKTISHTKFGYRWESKAEYHGVFPAHEYSVGSHRNVLRLLIKIRSFFPIFELHKGHSGVLTRTGQTETCNGHYALYVVLFSFHEIFLHSLNHRKRSLLGRSGWQCYLNHQGALVFIRHESGRNLGKAEYHHRNQKTVDNHESSPSRSHVINSFGCAVGTFVEHSVKPAEKASFGFFFMNRFKNGCAQCRSQS